MVVEISRNATLKCRYAVIIKAYSHNFYGYCGSICSDKFLCN